jgi:competence protein ComEA
VRAALGGVVVLALVGVGAAVLSSALTPGGQTTVLPGGAGGDGSSASGGSGGSSGAGSGESGAAGDALLDAEVVVVHVLGAVREPGIVELPIGSRVVDAVAAARGPTDDADLAGVNLARVLVDGEQLVVPRMGEVPAVGANGGAGGASGSSGATDAQGRVNINLADASALEALPGVGPALAGRIIAWREQNGPFRSVDELTAVAGIGEKTLAGFRDQATV